MGKSTRHGLSPTRKSSELEPLIERVSTFAADNYWDLGRFLSERVIPTALKEGIFADEIMKRMAQAPGFKFPYSLLKHCHRLYAYYPNLDKHPLPEMFYFELASKVDDAKRRDQYERMAITNKWTISDLQKKIREDELARREDEKTRFGFDLKERSIWSFDIPDPRFGKPGAKGRLPGQIVANALFYYTEPGWLVVDPMAGSGTTGDVVDGVPYFGDRSCHMYDVEPLDPRVVRANVLQTGIPESSGSVDYVFLDPPHEFYPRGNDPDLSPASVKAETMSKLKTILRETVRTLKPGGRFSIIVEATSGAGWIIDFPFEATALARDLGMMLVGKVYLPRKAESSKARAHVQVDHDRSLISECRELLTFEKLHS
jgi:hypothetical protein